MPSPTIDAAARDRDRERAMLVAGLSDLALAVAMLGIGLWANSLMIQAEVLRGILLLLLEMLLLLLLRRIHRGQTYSFDYGAGKLEQFANLAIGAAMILGGLWVGGNAAYRWWNPPAHSELGLIAAAIVGAVNAVQNGATFWMLYRSGRDGASVIMRGQVRSRPAKLVSSCIVLAALCLNAALGSGPIGEMADVFGSAFVALVMLELAVSMWRKALPSLLDRTLEEAQQRLINRALASHFEDYDALVAVHSRLSGNTPLVEIVLRFQRDRLIGDVQRVVDAIAATIGGLLPASVVSVTPVAGPLVSARLKGE